MARTRSSPAPPRSAARRRSYTVPLSAERSRLADYLRRRRQLVDMRKAEKLHLHSAGRSGIAADVETMIALLDCQITDLDRHIAGDSRLAEQARLLAAVPSIGPTVLATLLGELPGLGLLCRRRIPRSPALRATPARATLGAALGASRADAARCARPFRSPPSAPRVASPCLPPCATGCAPNVRSQRPSSSPSPDGFSPSSTP